jgi:hypothetical protein
MECNAPVYPHSAFTDESREVLQQTQKLAEEAGGGYVGSEPGSVDTRFTLLSALFLDCPRSGELNQPTTRSSCEE